MSLELCCARSLTAALDSGVEAWRRARGYLVVPRPGIATRALEAAAGPGGAVLDLEAVTLAGLRGRVARASGAADPEPVPAISVRLALEAILDRLDLAAIGPSAQAPGFLTAVERAIGELRGSRVPAARLRSAASAPVTRALADIYEAALDDRVPQPSDAAWEVAGLAAALSDFQKVTVVGFDDIDPASWALLRALGGVTDVVVHLPFDEAREVFAARRDRFARWREQADRTVRANAPANGGRRMADALFEDGPPWVGEGSVRLLAAAGTRGMLRTALEDVLALWRSGHRLSECALVVPRLADLRDDLDRLLDDWGIPAHRSTRVRVMEAPIALALTHLMEFGELDRDDPAALDHLLGWLRTPYSDVAPDAVDDFEVAMRRAVLAGRSKLMSRLGDDSLPAAIRLVAAGRQGPRAQLAAMLDIGWSALRRVGASEERPSRADLRDRAALGALAGLAAAVPDDLVPDEPGGRPRGPLPRGALGRIVADLTFVEREGPEAGLAIHDMASLRGHSYRAVVIAGLDGDGYPAGPGADPLLGPLREALSDLLPPRAPGTTESRLRMVHAVDAAREHLTVVRRLVDDEGREVTPSPYWVELLRHLPSGARKSERRSGARGEVVEPGGPAPNEAEALRALALDGGSVAGPLEAALGRRRRETGLPSGSFDARTSFRVTEIEGFLRCPYGWLHGSALSPRAISEPPDAAFEGSLAHLVLERLYGDLAPRIGPCRVATLPEYRAALPPILRAAAEERRPADAPPDYARVVDRLEHHLLAMLGREAALDSELIPTIFEYRMTDRSILAAVAPGLELSGQVDRLDLTPPGDGALVIDYKRSGRPFNPAHHEIHQRMQLPLYGAMAEADPEISTPAIGGLYVGVLAPEIGGAIRDDVPGVPAVGPRQLVTAERWTELMDEAAEAARGAVRAIRAGQLAAPPETGCPPWCGCVDLWR